MPISDRQTQHTTPHAPATAPVPPAPATPENDAKSAGIAALALALGAVALSPVLMLIPYAGFIPVIMAAAGAGIAGRALRRRTQHTSWAVTGLVVAVITTALLSGIATFWNLMVADPAVRDYPELHEALEYAKRVIFG